MLKRYLLALVLSISTVASLAVEAQTNNAPYVVDNTAVYKVPSAIVPGQVYEVRVSVPASYQSSPDKTYPVIVALDGQWNFTITSDIVSNLAYDGMMPEAIVAAITWGGEGDDPGELRTRDFLRPQIPWIPLSGGAELFLNALTDELVPFVESRYRIAGKRVLLGGSLAGLFTTYAMLEKPGYFDGYIAIAGSYAMDSEYILEKIASFAYSADFRSVRSYLAVGSLDPLRPGVDEVYDEFRSAKLRGFKQRYKVFNGVGHSGVSAIAYTYGLQYTFKRPALKLSEDFLQQYAGEFSGGPEGYEPLPISVSVVGRGKLGIGGISQFSEYLAESETRFYLNGVNVTVEFTDNDHFVMNSQGTLMFFSRVMP